MTDVPPQISVNICHDHPAFCLFFCVVEAAKSYFDYLLASVIDESTTHDNQLKIDPINTLKNMAVKLFSRQGLDKYYKT